MSDRHARNHRKARKRMAKLLREANALPVPEGFSVHAEASDFGYRLTMCVQRDADGCRNAATVLADRLWRRMNGMPAMLVGFLGRARWPDVKPE